MIIRPHSLRPDRDDPMNVLVVDIGGNRVKILIVSETDPRKYPSRSKMTPEEDFARAETHRGPEL
jgi:hypothetical protein